MRIDTSGSLGKLLERTDLMVSNTSTSIEEALTCRVPVFLNTWRRRYFHFPARLVPPTEDDRGAVYGTRSADAIAPMLAAIMAAHRRPLKDEEVRGLIWLDDDIVGPAVLAGRLIEPADRELQRRHGRHPDQKLTEQPHA